MREALVKSRCKQGVRKSRYGLTVGLGAAGVVAAPLLVGANKVVVDIAREDCPKPCG